MLADGALAGLAQRTLDLLRSLGDPALAPFLAGWPADVPPRISPAGGESRATPPVLRCLAHFAADAAAFGAPLVAELCRLGPRLVWRQTYAAAEVGEAFLRNYAYAEIVGLHSILSRRVACGFLVLGPSTLYPRHRHEAAEVYLPLRGTAQWLQGDAVWRERRPGTVIVHAGDETHSMRTGAEPLLALYLWRSKNLQQQARLERPAT